MCIKIFFRFSEFPGMEQKEKDYTKLRLASCVRKILKENKLTEIKNKDKGVEDMSLVDSMRQIEAASGLSFTIIQSTSAGKRDPQFTTLITLIESLGMSFSKFAGVYDKITEAEIEEVKKEIGNKSRKLVKNSSTSKKNKK